MNNQTAPYSQEAEEAVLGSAIMSPNIYPVLADILHADDFFLQRHGTIWRALERLSDRGETIDYLTIVNELTAMKQIEAVGGPAYLTQLVTSVPTSSHAEVYAQIVERAAIRRRLMAAADGIKTLAVDENLTTGEVMGEVENLLTPLRAQAGGRQSSTLSDSLTDYMNTIDSLISGNKAVSGIASGLTALDTMLGGWQRGDMVIVAGRPGSGKTSFALHAAYEALVQGYRVGVVSMEMSIDQLTRRLITMHTGIPYSAHANGLMNTQNYKRVLTAAGDLAKFSDRLHINDRPGQTPASIRAEALRWRNRGGLDLLVVDYLQLGNSDERHRSQYEQITAISKAMKQLARELNIPVMALAQLSRAVEQRADKRPVLSDLRDSGQIEQDADVVMFLYRESMYDDAAIDPLAAEIIVSKHRNGQVGTVNAIYEGKAMRFANGTRTAHKLYEGNGR